MKTILLLTTILGSAFSYGANFKGQLLSASRNTEFATYQNPSFVILALNVVNKDLCKKGNSQAPSK